VLLFNSKAVLSQWKPRDATVNFNTAFLYYFSYTTEYMSSLLLSNSDISNTQIVLQCFFIFSDLLKFGFSQSVSLIVMYSNGRNTLIVSFKILAFYYVGLR